jgi:hypothetical protein
MRKITKTFIGLTASVAMGVSSLVLTPSAALAKSDAETVSSYFATALKPLNKKPVFVWHLWDRYPHSSYGSDDWFERSGEEYVILGVSAGNLSTPPYKYSYKYDDNPKDKSPGEIHAQGIAGEAGFGGSWMRRGDLNGFLPARIARLDDDVIVTDLEGRLARQAQTISGLSPTEKAASILGYASTFPVTEGSLRVGIRPGEAQSNSWSTGAYVNYAGDTCNDSRVTAFLTPLLGDQLRLTEYSVEEHCVDANGEGVTSVHRISVRPWNALVGAAPQPNVSAQR